MVDSKLLPLMNFDLGLRNSIRTSLSYLGFLVAAGLALGYLGLNYESSPLWPAHYRSVSGSAFNRS